MKNFVLLLLSVIAITLLIGSCSSGQTHEMAEKKRLVIESANAPKPIGPYSQAIRVGDMVFLSGQIGIDPATGTMDTVSVELQAEQAMKNLQAVLQEAGLSFSDVVKTSIFLTDIADFQRVNAVYGKYFNEAPPARETVQVAALPRGAKLEISMIAVQATH